MSNLEHNLSHRIEALFQSDIKKGLLEKAENVFSSIKAKQTGNSFENLQENLNAMKRVLEELPKVLLDYGNNALSDFEKEIDSVPEPEKSQGYEKLKELIFFEIQEIIKKMTTAKFHE